MSKKKLSTLLAICLAVGLMVPAFTAACAPSPPAAGKPVKIGVLNEYTGAAGVLGPWMEKGAQFAVHEVGGEVAGRPIKLIFEDAASDMNMSLDKARKLIEGDKVDVLVGPIFSHIVNAVAAHTAQSRTPHMIVTQASIEVLRHGGRNVFMHGGTLRGSGYPLGLYAYDVMGARTATVIHDDFDAGEELTQGAMDAFVSRGGIIVQRQRTPLDIMDYGPYLTAMKKADIVMFWFVPLNAQRFIMQYYDYGRDMPLVQTGCTTLSELQLRDIGDKSLGLLSGHTYDAGVDTPAAKDWVDRYVKTYGHLSEEEGRFPRFAEGLSMYMAVRLPLEAVKATGGDTSHEALNEALRKLRWESPWGLISFTDYGLGIGDQKILKVIKEGDRYYRTDIQTYKQIELREPEAVRDLAPRM